MLCYFGDGASSEGITQEAMNFAGAFQAPIVFVCVNNQWAISMPRSRQTRAKTLAHRALAYGFPGVQVDGNDLLAMVAVTREAVARAREGGGPTLIEAVTYRLTPHSTADDPKKYREETEVKAWEAREPLPRLRRYLEAKGLVDDALARPDRGGGGRRGARRHRARRGAHAGGAPPRHVRPRLRRRAGRGRAPSGRSSPGSRTRAAS